MLRLPKRVLYRPDDLPKSTTPKRSICAFFRGGENEKDTYHRISTNGFITIDCLSY